MIQKIFQKITLLSILLIVVNLCFSNLLFCQIKKIGTPNITNYPKSIYNAGVKNWSIEQDKRGVMYFGNHFGVLKFDANNWSIIATAPNKTMIRSLAIDKNDKIYVGCQNDFGILQKEINGSFEYNSLIDFVPQKNRNFKDIWQIMPTDKSVIFLSLTTLFIWEKNKMKVIEQNNEFQSIFNVNDNVYIIEQKKGLLQLNDNRLQLATKGEGFSEFDVKFLLHFNDEKLLVGTLYNGLFLYDTKNGIQKWESEASNFLFQNKVTCGISIAENYIAAGTIQNGVIIFDKTGKVIQHFNQDKGLQNNNIIALKVSLDENLWITNGAGIDYAEIASPFSYIGTKNKFNETVYDAQIYKDKLFVATYQGLYYTDWNNCSNALRADNSFKLFNSLSQTCWKLNVIDGDMFIGHNTGAYQSDGVNITKISDLIGSWLFKPTLTNENCFLAGFYRGVNLYEKQNDTWTKKWQVEGIEEARIIEFDNDNIVWNAHGYKGVYKVKLDKKMEKVIRTDFYDTKKGFPTNLFISVYKIRGEILFGTEKGVYKYNKETDMMEEHPVFKKIFGADRHVRKLIENNDGSVWFIIGDESNDQTGIIKFEDDNTYKIELKSLQKLKGKHVPGFENIRFFDNNVFIGTKKGLLHYDLNIKKDYHKPFYVEFNKISSKDLILYGADSQLLYDSLSENNIFLNYENNALLFDFSAVYYESSENTVYSNYLEGFDQDWCEWTTNSHKEYTNLHEGEYIFKLKAKNLYDIESDISTFKFIIAPPLYRSKIAYYIYIFLFLLVSFLLVKFIFYRIQRSKFKEKVRYQQELQKKEEQFRHKEVIAEKEIIKLKNDKLQTEVDHRDKELANQTMDIIQKNRFLIQLNDELKLILNSTDDKFVKNKISLLKKRINKDIDNKEQNKIFETYFDEIHEAFFNRLKDKYPDLSPKELRLCAFIRMNHSTKDISTLLNISYRGVEISRYRLRKKLLLSREINLATFLSNI